MKNYFAKESIHTVTEANINFYSSPFVHPRRKMEEHDFIYVLEGEWKFGQKDEYYHMKKNSLLILPANEEHFGAEPCSAKTKTMYFHVKYIPEDRDGGICLQSLFEDCGNGIKKIFSSIVHSVLSGNARRASLYFELLLCELLDHSDNGTDTRISVKIRNMIHDNPELFFANSELANAVNVSVKTAENKFKATYGVTIHQYALDFKIKEAMNYFEVFPDVSIKEVAYNLGFYDEYHFSRQFKRSTGLSPKSYRQKLKQ
jgi:AraC-like DNA-binding protein